MFCNIETTQNHVHKCKKTDNFLCFQMHDLKNKDSNCSSKSFVVQNKAIQEVFCFSVSRKHTINCQILTLKIN